MTRSGGKGRDKCDLPQESVDGHGLGIEARLLDGMRVRNNDVSRPGRMSGVTSESCPLTSGAVLHSIVCFVFRAYAQTGGT